MDGYTNINEYANSKKNIYSGNCLMVINQDDDIFRAMGDESMEAISFSLS